MAIKISGVTIIDDSRNIVSGAAATFTSNVTIGGTLTYEDVTNIDSVGIITAREGIKIPNTKQIQLGDSQELSFYNSTNTAHIQHTGSGFLFISGNDIALRSLAQKSYIVCDSDNEVSLYFNNSPKFQTTNTGVEVIHAGGGVLNVTSINATDGDYAGIVTAQGFVGGGINTLSESIFKDMSVLGGINISGVATATAFSGDGSNLTNLPVSSFFTNTDVGIHTLAKVGIGTTNPIAQLDVNVGSSVTALNIEGSEGQLFSVTNNLSSGSIFAVNDITGLPSVDVNADGTIQLAPRGAGELVGIGTTVPTSKLHLVGDALVTGIGTFSGVDVTGGTLERSSTGNKLMFVGSCETRITHSSGSKVCFDFHGSGGFLGRIDAHAGALVIANGGGKASLVARNQGSTELYYDNAGTATKRFQTTNTGAKVVGILTATSITSPKYDGDADRNIIMGCCAGIAITDTVTDACRNVIIGCSAGRKVCSGINAVIIGACAGHELTCAGSNVLMGEFAACKMCCGFNNVVIGKRTGMGLTGRTSCADSSLGANSNVFIGSYAANCMRRECNVVIGAEAGRYNENGQQNVWIGQGVFRGPQASFATNCGYANVFLGSGAGYSARGGQYNVVIGRNVGSSISTGANHIFIGCGAGTSQISGFNNIFMGNLAGACVTTGTQSIFMGQHAGRLNVSGALKIAIGDNAGECGMGATENGGIAIGYCSQRCSTCGSGNVALGNGSGKNLTCGQNIMIGGQTGVNATAAHGNTFVGSYTAGCFKTGQRNTFVGCNAGFGHTVGTFNVMLGACSGPRTCGAVGECNIFIGGYTASAMCCGLANVLIGTHAGQCLRNAYCNVFLGRKAGLGQTSGSFNFYVGNHAGPSTCGASGCDNVGLGRNTMRLSTGAAHRNIAIGLQAGYCVTGSYNIFFGCGAGELVTSGSRNIIIGCGVDAPSATGSDQFAIGCGTSRWISGDSSFNVCLAGAGVTATAAGTVCSCRVAANKYLGDCNSNVIFGGLAGLGVTLSNNIHHNVLLGCIAGYSLSTQCHVIAIGKNTAKCVHTGAGQHVIIGGDAGRYVGDLGCGTYGNVLIGVSAGHCQVGACANVSIGVEAGRSVHGCSQMHCDINIGFRAGCLVKGGYNNVRIGRLAGVSNSTGIDNIMIGNVAGYHNLTGNDNIVMGESAGYCFCTGGSNVILGTSAGKCGVSQSAQVIIGNGAGYNQDGDLNVAVGYLALRCSGVAAGNVAIGGCAMCGATAPGSSTGCCNIGIGYGVGNKMSSGNRNTLVGAQAGSSLTTGSYNILFGMNSGQNLTTGSRNIVMGTVQAPSATGSNTLTIGCCACTWIKGDSSFNTTLAGITTAKSDGTFLVGAGVTLHASGEAAFAGVTTFTGHNTGTGSLHLPNNKMAVFGNNYLYGAIYQTGAQLTFQALNSYKFCVWDGGGFADWLNVNGVGGQITLGGCSMGISGSTNKTHMFRLSPHKITMCSSVPDSATQTKRFELDSYGIQLTGITTIAGNVNVTGVVTATHFYGDGSNLTGISGGGGGISTTFFASSAAGIHTLSKVGIGTAIPNAQLDVNVGSSVTAFNVEGSEGQLFSITNNLSSGSIFAVNDITGLPSIDVNADGTIQLAPRGAGELVGIGTTVPTSKLHLVGDALVTGIITASRYGADSSCNVAMGHNAGACLTSGTCNILIGFCAGRANTSAGSNIYIGRNTGAGNATGGGNLVIGDYAAGSSTFFQNIIAIGCCSATTAFGSNDGNGGIAIGTCAARFATTNVLAIGANAGCQTTGAQNTFMGTNTGLNNTSGCYNTFLGYTAGSVNSTGCCNTFVGRGAGGGNQTGGANIYLGMCSGPQGTNASGCHNFIGGFKSGNALTSGSCNILVGLCAGLSITSGINNIAMGLLAGTNTGIGSENVFIGSCTGLCNTEGRCNVFIGKYAGKCNSTGNYNIAIGDRAGCCLKTCTSNVLIGLAAGMKLCGGSANIFIGNQTGICATTSGENVVMGTVAGKALSSGVNNVAIGKMSGCKLYAGSSNVLLGNCSGYCLQGLNNVMIGMNAGFHRSGNKYCRNVLIGQSSGDNATTLAVDNFDVLIGYLAGRDYTGSCSIGIGHSVNLPINDGQNQLAIGQHDNNWIVGNCDYNVGIGTTAPTSKLHVGGDVLVTGISTFSEGFAGDILIDDKIVHRGDTNTAIRFPANDTISFETAGTERLRVVDTGVVMTGVTTVSASAHISNANGSVFFGAGSATAYGSQGGIGRASTNGFHIAGSLVGDLVMGAEGSKRIIFGTKPGTGIGGMLQRLTIFSDGSITQNHGNLNDSATFKISKSGAGAAELRFDTASANTASLILDEEEQLKIRYGGTEHTRFSSDGNVKVGAGITLEGGGDAYVTGITTLGRGSTGDVYLYNPADSALSGTENSVYGWKAKTYCAGLQVNSALYLSRSGANGLGLAYNNATGSYITAYSGFLRVGVPYGGDLINYSSNVYIKDRLQTNTFGHFTTSKVDLYSNNAIKLSTTNEGILVSGGATFTGNLSVGGTVTYEDVSNVDSIGIVTARQGIQIPNDTYKLRAGTDLEMQVWHDGTNSLIKDTRDSGKVRIQADNFDIIDKDASTTVFSAAPGGINSLKLHNFVHINVSGISTFNGDVTLGNSSSDEVSFNADVNTNILPSTNGNKDLGDSGNRWGEVHAVTFHGSGANLTNLPAANITGIALTLTSTDAGSSAGPEFKLFRNSASPADADYLGQIKFAGESDTGVERNYAKITGKILDASNGTEDGIIEFAHIKAGSQVITGRWRSDSLQLLNGTNLTVNGNITLDQGSKLGFSTDSNTFIGQDNLDRLDFNAGGKRLVSINEGTNQPVVIIDKDGVNTGPGNSGANYNANPHATDLVLGNTSSNNHGMTIVSPSDSYGNIQFSDGSGGGLDATRGSIVFTHSDNKLNLKSKIGSIVLTHKDVDKLATTDTGVFIGILTATSITSPKYLGDADLNIVMGSCAGIAITDTTTTACYNVLIGRCAGSRISTCQNNIFIGSCAGQYAIAPTLTVAIGEAAGRNANATGGTLTAVGAFAGMCNTDGDGNTLIGFGAGYYATGSGSAYNFYGGYNAGRVANYNCSDSPTGGSCNIALGMNAFSARAGGGNNVILGRYAGYANSTGSNNVAFGNGSLMCNVTGGNNFAGGYLTMTQNLTGNLNVAIGHAAMRCNVSGAANVGIGYCALAMNTCGNDNIALGQCAMRCHDTNGGNNFAAGYSALRESEGSHNQVIGHTAGYCNTTGCYNVAIGHQANKLNTTGCHNISLGYLSAQKNETNSDNISIGQYSNYCNKAGANIAIGRKASFHDDVATNGFNVAIGDCAFMGGTNMGTRKHNVAIGIMAGGVSTAGSGNVFVGCYSGYCNGGGSTNVYMSRKAGYFNLTGHDNVMIGDCAGFGISGGTNQNCNVFIGKYAGYCNRGDNNIGIGLRAGEKIQTATCNIFMGPSAGRCASTGSNNIAMGYNVMNLANLTGDNNIALGHYTGRRIATGGGNVFLGAGAGRYVLGGCCNVAIGINAHYCLSGGNCNVAIGVHAGTKQTASDQNVSIGHLAGSQNCTGSGNVAVGHSAGHGIRGANNVSIGATAGPANSCTNTCDNVFIGSRTGTAYTSGCNIIAIGINAGASSCCAAVGCNNIHIGQNTGCKVQSGDNNITIGCRAGRNLTTGKCNIFMGLYAGGTISDTSGNIAIGNRAGQNSAGGNTLAIGCCAGGQFGGGQAAGIFIGRCAGRYANASDSPNILIGNNTGRSITNGQNIIIGDGAAYPATTACRNVGMGGQAHQKLTTGDGNVALGAFSLMGNTVGCCNIAIGDVSGAANEGATGSCNVTISVGSGHSLTTGSDNIFVGRCSGYGVTSGYKNISIGLCAGYGHANPSVAGVGFGTDNVFIGSCAGRCVATASRNVFIGREAGQRINDGCYNVAIGDQAGCCMMSGHSNTVVGSFAAYHLCSGGSNVYMGLQAALCATTGSQNTIIGNTAGKTLSTGGSNVAVGHFAGCTLGAGGGNVMMGNCAGYRSSGNHNVMLGHSSGWDRQGGQFKYNVLVGSYAGYARGTQPDGAFDVLIGFYAGATYTGSCSIGIGHSLVMPITDGKNQLAIGQEGNYWITGSSNRKVGIGISDPQNYFSSYNDMVVGNTGDTGGITIVSQNGSGGTIAFAKGKSGSDAYRGTIRYDQGNDKLQFNTNANTGQVTINNQGYLGINTASPAAPLHALGRIHTDRFFSNPTSLDTSVTFPESGGAVNGGVFGPYTIASGVTLTIASGSTFKVL